MSAPFTFAIALISRAFARDWDRIEALLGLTLASVRAQTDPDFQVLVMGHERPAVLGADPRVTFVRADWPPQPPGPDNGDAGAKKHLLLQRALGAGGGLFMYLDADDWVAPGLVEQARRRIAPDDAGAVLRTGFAVDFATGRAAPLPHPEVFEGGFHRLCGSSTIALLRPEESDPLLRDPCSALGSHHLWLEAARERGLSLARLPVPGGYLIGTAENHSELHGPFADWRAQFRTAVNRHGRPVDAAFLAEFGLTFGQWRAARRRAPASFSQAALQR